MAKSPSERELFDQAMSLPGGADLTTFLEEACQGDQKLAERVANLVESSREASQIFPDESSEPSAGLEQAGDEIGNYHLESPLGEGSFGHVWLARQCAPIQRQVALKIIKPGMDSQEVVARFEAERQALAVMDHPGIAKVFDAGTTELGRPYFVMELVEGQPLTRFCDDQKMGTRERLELFVGVCRAVQHAHQKGVVHRDLKPSNVLVTEKDGCPIAKVIDFGVAKAMEEKLTAQTLMTGLGRVIGTLNYMSPEQAGGAQDVDTRSDIYSLGVVLYELLSGTQPFCAERIKEIAYDEALKVIREEEPLKPSTQLIQLGETADEVATRRSTEVRKLARTVNGDLDWIVMRALEKDRDRRYETANAFARDVERYLNDEPVMAGRPSASYRLGKFVRRNRLGVAFATCVSLLLIAGIVATSLQAKRAMLAEAEARDSAVIALDAEAEAAKSLYYSRIQIAQREIDEGRITQYREVLDKYQNEASRNDEKLGWEYHFLRSLSLKYKLRWKGHEGAVNEIAMSLDGATFATAGDDGIVRIWESSTGSLIKEYSDHEGKVVAVAWSPDGHSLASADENGTAIIRATGDSPKIAPVKLHLASGIETICWVGNQKVAICDRGDVLLLWDVGSEGEPLELHHGIGTLLSLAWSPVRNALAVADDNGFIVVIDVPSGKELLRQRKSKYSAINGLAWSPDGDYLAIGSEHFLASILNVDTGKFTEDVSLHQGRINGMEWTKSNELFSYGNDEVAQMLTKPLHRLERVDLLNPAVERLFIASGQIVLNNVEDHLIVRSKERTLIPANDQMFIHSGEVTALGAGRGKLGFPEIFTGDSKGDLYRWQTESNLRALVIPQANWVSGISWSADGKELATSTFNHGWKVFDTGDGSLVRNIAEHQDRIWDLAFSPDGRRIATASTDGKLKIWTYDAESRPRQLLELMAVTLERIAWSPDGNLIAGIDQSASGKENLGLYLWDSHTGELLWKKPGKFSSIAWHPAENLLATGESAGVLRVWDGASGSEFQRFDYAEQFPDCENLELHNLSWKSDGSRLAFSKENSVCVANMWNGGELIFTTKPHTGEVLQIRWHPTEDRLATGGKDATVRILDGASGEEILALRDHSGEIRSLAWSPDGMKLASGSYGMEVIIWDATPGYHYDPNAAALTKLAVVGQPIPAASKREAVIRVSDLVAGSRRMANRAAEERRRAHRVTKHRLMAKSVRILVSRGELEQAEKELQDSLNALKRKSTPPGSVVIGSLGLLISGYIQNREFSKSLQLLEQLVEMGKPKTGLNSDHAGWLAVSLFEHFLSKGDLEEANRIQDWMVKSPFFMADTKKTLRMGIFLAHAGDGKRHHDFARILLLAAMDTRNSMTADGAAQVIAIHPESPPDLVVQARLLAERSVKLSPDSQWAEWFHATLGLARLRGAEYNKAQVSLDIASVSKDRLLRAYTHAALAMTHFHQEHFENSRRHLVIAELSLGVLATAGRANAPTENSNKLAPWLLIREARELITGSAEATDSAISKVLVAPDSEWRWFHPTDGIDPANSDPDFHKTFHIPDFDDRHWQTGRDSPAESGGTDFGHDWFKGIDIGDPRSKNLGKSAYFRHRFTTTGEFQNLEISYQRDDWIIIYLDGKEVARDNMKDWEEGHHLTSVITVGQNADIQLREQETSRVLLRDLTLPPGEHVLAISLHNTATPSSDLRVGGITLSGQAKGPPQIGPTD